MFKLEYLKFLPYILLALIIYIFIMTIILFLILYNVIDIHSIVNAMKQCYVAL